MLPPRRESHVLPTRSWAARSLTGQWLPQPHVMTIVLETFHASSRQQPCDLFCNRLITMCLLGSDRRQGHEFPTTSCNTQSLSYHKPPSYPWAYGVSAYARCRPPASCIAEMARALFVCRSAPADSARGTAARLRRLGANHRAQSGRSNISSASNSPRSQALLRAAGDEQSRRMKYWRRPTSGTVMCVLHNSCLRQTWQATNAFSASVSAATWFGTPD